MEQNLYDYIRDVLIPKGRSGLRPALETLRRHSGLSNDNDVKNRLVHLQGRYQNNEDSYNNRTINREDYNHTLNQISESLLEYLEVWRDDYPDLKVWIEHPIGEIKTPPDYFVREDSDKIIYLKNPKLNQIHKFRAWYQGKFTEEGFSSSSILIVFISFFVVVGLLYAIAAVNPFGDFFDYFFRNQDEIHKLPHYYAQLISSFCCILCIPFFKNLTATEVREIATSYWKGELRIAEEDIEQALKIIGYFKNFLYLIWGGRFLLYVLKIGHDAPTHLGASLHWEPSIWKIFFNITRLIAAVGAIGCFSILYHRDNKEKEKTIKYEYLPMLFATFLGIIILFQVLKPDNVVKAEILGTLSMSCGISLLTHRICGRLINPNFVFPFLFYTYTATNLTNAVLTSNFETPTTAVVKTLLDTFQQSEQTQRKVFQLKLKELQKTIVANDSVVKLKIATLKSGLNGSQNEKKEKWNPLLDTLAFNLKQSNSLDSLSKIGELTQNGFLADSMKLQQLNHNIKYLDTQLTSIINSNSKERNTLKTFAGGISMGVKALLFLYIMWLVETGKLAIYLLEIKQTVERRSK